MKIFTVETEIPGAAVDALRNGEIVCYPTETFYGLGIDPSQEAAREKLFAAKGRSAEKELPLIASDFEMVASFCDATDARVEKLCAKFWPGPLTIVLPAKDRSRTWAIRVSSHPIARMLAREFGHPIVSTSANLSGMPPIQVPNELAESIQEKVKILLDAGRCAGGAPSTIISLLESPGKILRKGAIPAEEIVSLL